MRTMTSRTTALLSLLLLAVSADRATAQAPVWTVSSGPHEFTMTVTAAVVADGVPMGAAGDLVCAYVANEPSDLCRGVAEAMLVGTGSNARHLFFLTIYGTNPGESLRFRIWDASDDALRFAADSLGFTPNAVIGDPAMPHALRLSVNRSLAVGWNLIGYDQPVAQPVTEGLGDLIRSDKLIYAVGFDETGATFFDPVGLDFLNTLRTLEPRSGYWVKLSAPHADLTFPTPAGKTQDTGAEGPPSVQFLQGRAQEMIGTGYQDVRAGSLVEVLSSDGIVLATAEVLADGLLMTTPIYGRDSAPAGASGAAPGERLRFRLGETIIDPDIVFQGSLDPIRTTLRFGEETPVESDRRPIEVHAVWPNPASNQISVRYSILQAGPVDLKVFDILGRSRFVLAEGLAGDAGTHEVTLHVDDWAPGVYVVVLSAAAERQTRSLTVVR